MRRASSSESVSTTASATSAARPTSPWAMRICTSGPTTPLRSSPLARAASEHAAGLGELAAGEAHGALERARPDRPVAGAGGPRRAPRRRTSACPPSRCVQAITSSACREPRRAPGACRRRPRARAERGWRRAPDPPRRARARAARSRAASSGAIGSAGAAGAAAASAAGSARSGDSSAGPRARRAGPRGTRLCASTRRAPPPRRRPASRWPP